MSGRLFAFPNREQPRKGPSWIKSRIFQSKKKNQKLDQPSNQNHSLHVKQCPYPQWYWKLWSKSFKCYVQFNNILHVIWISFVCTPMSHKYHSLSFVCHSHVTCMCLYVIRMSLVCGFTMNHFQILSFISRFLSRRDVVLQMHHCYYGLWF